MQIHVQGLFSKKHVACGYILLINELNFHDFSHFSIFAHAVRAKIRGPRVFRGEKDCVVIFWIRNLLDTQKTARPEGRQRGRIFCADFLLLRPLRGPRAASKLGPKTPWAASLPSILEVKRPAALPRKEPAKGVSWRIPPMKILRAGSMRASTPLSQRRQRGGGIEMPAPTSTFA